MINIYVQIMRVFERSNLVLKLEIIMFWNPTYKKRHSNFFITKNII
jgi:hypothetical protein